MTTAAPLPAAHEELEERTRMAWDAYRDSLRDLTGADYDQAEDRSWDLLQRELRDIEDRRAELEGRLEPAPPAA